MAGAELAFACCALLIAFAPAFSWILTARIVLALGAGLYTATALSTAAAISPVQSRGRAIGIVVAGQSLALLAGAPAGAFIAEAFGWRAVYGVIAAIGLCAATALALRLPSGLSGDQRTLVERIGVLTVPGVGLALLTTILFQIAGFLPLIYVAPLALQSAGLGRGALPMVLLANGLGAVAGSAFGGRFSDRMGPRRAIILSLAAEVLVLLAFALVPLLPLGLASVAFLVVMALTGLIGWGSWPAQSSRLADLAPQSVPLALALNLTALNIGVALAATIGGSTVDRIGAEYIAPIALPFVLAALMAAHSNRHDPRIARAEPFAADVGGLLGTVNDPTPASAASCYRATHIRL